MPTTLGRPYSLDWRGNPGHMLQSDIPVWYRFLDLWGWKFLNIYYDCLLGGPHLTPQQEKDPLKTMWRYTISKRADVIAETENEIWIIEVARDPGLRAIGQLLTYRVLWIEDQKIFKPERLVVVSELLDKDLAASAATYGLEFYVV